MQENFKVPFDDISSREKRGKNDADPLLIEAFIFVFNWLKMEQPTLKKENDYLNYGQSNVVEFEDLFNKDTINIEFKALNKKPSRNIEEFLNKDFLQELLKTQPIERSKDEKLLIDTHCFLMSAIIFGYIDCYGYYYNKNIWSNNDLDVKNNEFENIFKSVSYSENLMLFKNKEVKTKFVGLKENLVVANIHIVIKSFLEFIDKESNPNILKVSYLKKKKKIDGDPIKVLFMGKTDNFNYKNKLLRMLFWLDSHKYQNINLILLNSLSRVLKTTVKPEHKPCIETVNKIVNKYNRGKIGIEQANYEIRLFKEKLNLEGLEYFLEIKKKSSDALRKANQKEEKVNDDKDSKKKPKIVYKKNDFSIYYEIERLKEVLDLKYLKKHIESQVLNINDNYILMPCLSKTKIKIVFEDSFIENVIKK